VHIEVATHEDFLQILRDLFGFIATAEPVALIFSKQIASDPAPPRVGERTERSVDEDGDET
jgi:hypothetical protein